MDHTGNSYEYVARDYIELNPGFEYEALLGEEYFIGRIDETLVFPVDYITPIDPDDYEIDVSLPVGVINGAASVSP